MVEKVLNFFDKLEDHIRETLSKMPLLYTLIGGVSIVLFWRGVWHTADLFPILTGPVSILISLIVLLATGLFVSFFVGDVIIISGLKKEKKIIEKTELEVEGDMTTLGELKKEMDDIKRMMEDRSFIEASKRHAHHYKVPVAKKTRRKRVKVAQNVSS